MRPPFLFLRRQAVSYSITSSFERGPLVAAVTATPSLPFSRDAKALRSGARTSRASGPVRAIAPRLNAARPSLIIFPRKPDFSFPCERERIGLIGLRTRLARGLLR